MSITKRMTALVLALIMVLMVFPAGAIATGQTVTVEPGESISQAILDAGVGGTIILGEGTHMLVGTQNPGNAGIFLLEGQTLSGAPGADVTIDGTGIDFGAQGGALIRARYSNIVMEGFTIVGPTAAPAGVPMAITIERSEVYPNPVPSNVTVHNITIAAAGRHGINVNGVDGLTITDVTFGDIAQGHGIQIMNAQNVEILDNDFSDMNITAPWGFDIAMGTSAAAYPHVLRDITVGENVWNPSPAFGTLGITNVHPDGAATIDFPSIALYGFAYAVQTPEGTAIFVETHEDAIALADTIPGAVILDADGVEVSPANPADIAALAALYASVSVRTQGPNASTFPNYTNNSWRFAWDPTGTNAGAQRTNILGRTATALGDPANATQAEVEYLLERLLRVENQLIPQGAFNVTFIEGRDIIEQGQGNYTDESWAALQAALAQWAPNAHTPRTSAQLEAQRNAILTAIAGLVYAVPPTITTTTLPGGTVGVAYNQTLAATGDAPITWAVTTGSLPAGLSLNADTGAITGTPTTADSVTFTVTASNDAGTDTQELTIVIAPATPPTITWPTASDITPGAALSASTLTGGSTEHGTFAWTNPAYVPAVPGGSFQVTFTPTDMTNIDWSGVTLTQDVAVVVNPAAPPTITWPTASDITFGAALSASTLTGGSTEHGTFTWTNPAYVPAVPGGSFQVTFTPADTTNIDWTGVTLTQNVNVVVNPATPPTITWPTASDITFGAALSASTLTGGSTEHGTFAWTNPAYVPEVPGGSFQVTFTPADTTNIDWTGVTLTQDVAVVVNPATPPTITWPTASDITFGAALSASTLTGGSTEHGTFAWTNPAYVPEVPGGSFQVTFTPADMTNIDWSGVTLTQNVNVVVNPATPPTITWPTASDITFGAALSAATLTGGSTEHGTFAWTNPAYIPAVPGGSFQVTFTPTDMTNIDWTGVTLTQDVAVVVNPAPVPPNITTTTLGSGVEGQTFTTVTLAATGDTPMTWTVTGLPAGLSFNTTTNAISGTPTAAGTFNVTVRATNAVDYDEEVFTLVIDPAPVPPTITTTTLPGGTVGVAYNQTLTATGDAPITWAVTTGSLPAGLSLNADTGAITGTPTSAGSVTFTVTATNDAGSATQELTIVVASASAQPTVLIHQVHGAGGRTGAVSHSFIELYNTSDVDADLTGFSVQVSPGGNNDFAVLELTGYTISARSSLLIVLPTGPPNAGEAPPRYVIEDWDIEWTGQTINNNGFAVALVQGYERLPRQLPHDINALEMVALGVVDLVGAINDQDINNYLVEPTGQVSRQRIARRVALSNTGNNRVDFTTHDYRITGITEEQLSQLRPRYSGDGPWTPVLVAPAIATTSLSDGAVGAAYTATLVSTGDPTITWSITAGTLPAGLTLNAANGAITGTPTTAGTFTFTVTATNDAGYATRVLEIEIATDLPPVPPTITTATLPAGRVDVVYTATLEATGDTPITWSVTPGTLPTGLTLNTTTGEITGTPTASGIFPFTVTATNNAGTDTKELSITITPAQIVGDNVLVQLIREVNTQADEGNQFNATAGVFMDVSHLTAWDNNVQQRIGAVGAQDRTPIVFNNGETYNSRGWRSVSASELDAGITVDTASAWQLRFETTGYENIRFSANQKSTGSGPDSFALAYSLDGPDGPFTMIPGSAAQPLRASDNSFEIIEDERARTYIEFELPDTVANQEVVYLRVFGYNFGRLNTASPERPDTMDDRQNGNTSINHIVVIGDPIEGFTPVRDITGVPETVTVGTDLTLRGTVTPATATNRTIIWSVHSAGGTGATITGNTLRATAVGTVTVRATILNGLSETENFVKDFVIEVTEVVDTTALAAAIAESEYMVGELGYELTGTQPAVLLSARAALNAASTQAAVDTATANLLAVLDAVRRTALEQAIAQANDKAEATYVPATWTAFAQALADAQRVLAQTDPAATRDAITEARIALEAATAALVARELHEAYMFGNDRGYFMPRANISRAEVAAILARTMIPDFVEGELPDGMEVFDAFHDVSPDNWFYYYVAWAYSEDLVTGDGRERFLPRDPITREQLAAMLARTIDYAEEVGEMGFYDVNAISAWSGHYVYTVFREGWMVGDTENNFRPRANISRAEVATAVNRILLRVDSRDAREALLENEAIEREDYARPFPDVSEDNWFFPAVVGAANDHYLARDGEGNITWKYILTQPADDVEDVEGVDNTE